MGSLTNGDIQKVRPLLCLYVPHPEANKILTVKAERFCEHDGINAPSRCIRACLPHYFQHFVIAG